MSLPVKMEKFEETCSYETFKEAVEDGKWGGWNEWKHLIKKMMTKKQLKGDKGVRISPFNDTYDIIKPWKTLSGFEQWQTV